ncbi:hypothetical protein GGQ80_001008 [Sphingomonas jinjuensis]|uniref:Uncharacterized protein n=1 Tax=Sphingomonas jinjuensis TaxID=535907 RepID=A0A840F5D4_9SPHN|nr:hypothetical protein [Sphingomonas jinjuensis]MBB4153120.1 hypothetical protein [Sphingomonas jinjuensis]
MSFPLFLVLLASCCGYALLRGGAPERWSAALQLAAFAAGMPLHLAKADYRSIEFAGALIDGALFLALFVLAWRSTRFWPLYVAAWQLTTILVHLGKGLDPGMYPAGYAIQAQFWAYPMLLATAVGAWRHQRRLQTGVVDPAWKHAGLRSRGTFRSTDLN